MIFGKRRKYNGQVAALLPAFGFDLEDAGMMKTADVLDIAWQQKYTEYEGALFVAYLVYAGMIKAGEPRGNEVLEKIRFVSNDWVKKGIVRQELAAQFSSKTDAALSREQTPGL